ncbi:unnamed protein product [Amaranthus hypochondriacus]
MGTTATAAVAVAGLVVIIIGSISINSKHTLSAESDQTTRRVIRLGSWPPSCTSKCGNCRPCIAVQVAIQPGLTLPLEYYPEAWRCKCAHQLYMP